MRRVLQAPGKGQRMRGARAGETPSVSVLMYVYNQAPYLEKAIRSVVGQRGDFPAEVIIHDDASTDGSREIIRRYADEYPDLIIPILQDVNQMQQGIDFVSRFVTPRVTGKYIAYCEGDDYWTDKRKLSLQIDILDRHPEYSGVCHNCVVVDAFGNRRKPVSKFFPFGKDFVYTLKELTFETRMPGQTASVMLRSSLYTDMPDAVREQYRRIRCCVGDRRRTLLMLLGGSVFCMKRTMSAYRYVTQGGTNWNTKVRGKNLAGRYFVQELDFRKFAKDCYGMDLHNDYALFGTGLMASLRVLICPSEENIAQYRMVVDALGGRKELVTFLIELFPRALLTLLLRSVQEIIWRIC